MELDVGAEAEDRFDDVDTLRFLRIVRTVGHQPDAQQE
jgi:hypothetical protein